MNRIAGLLLQHLDAVIYCSAFLLPFASELLQEVLYQTTGIRMRSGDAVFHLLGTGAVGFIGLLMLGSRLYTTFKIKPLPPIAFVLITAFTASLIIAACALALKGREGFCGGPLGDCGRWI